MTEECLKPEDWYFIGETNHSLMANCRSKDCWMITSFVPKKYFDDTGELRPTASVAEYKMFDESLNKIGLQWTRKKDTNSFHDNFNMPAPMTACFYTGTDQPNGVTTNLIQVGFEYNKQVQTVRSERGQIVLPKKLSSAMCIFWIDKWVREAYHANLLSDIRKLVPEHLQNDEFAYEVISGVWNREKKSKIQQTYKSSSHPKLKVVLETTDYKISSMTPMYIADEDDQTVKIKFSDDVDEKYFNFARDNFNRLPTKKDFQVFASAANLILTLPPSHGLTSVVKTLRGKSVSTMNRPEYGVAKEYKEALLWCVVNKLEEYLKYRGLLRYESPPAPKNPNAERAPDYISHRFFDPMELEMMMEQLKEMGDKYGK